MAGMEKVAVDFSSSTLGSSSVFASIFLTSILSVSTSRSIFGLFGKYGVIVPDTFRLLSLQLNSVDSSVTFSEVPFIRIFFKSRGV
jgi:hypothetical protein